MAVKVMWVCLPSVLYNKLTISKAPSTSGNHSTFTGEDFQSSKTVKVDGVPCALILPVIFAANGSLANSESLGRCSSHCANSSPFTGAGISETGSLSSRFACPGMQIFSQLSHETLA